MIVYFVRERKLVLSVIVCLYIVTQCELYAKYFSLINLKFKTWLFLYCLLASIISA